MESSREDMIITYIIALILGWMAFSAIYVCYNLIFSPELDRSASFNGTEIQPQWLQFILLLLTAPFAEIEFEQNTDDTMTAEELWKRVKTGVEGALPAGTRVEKCNSSTGARNPNGTQGTVVGSFGTPEEYQYVIKWDGADDDDGGIVVDSYRIQAI